MGLELKSPVIVSSCSLTADAGKIELMEKYGAGAVVLKSLFEEQISNEAEFLSGVSDSYPEMGDYLHGYIRHNSVADYKEKVRTIKERVSIPVIASINCYSRGEWTAYAREIEAAGADAIELNLYEMPTGRKTSPDEIEQGYCDTVRDVVKNVHVPVSVKISSHLTGIVWFADRLSSCGAKGVVVFNRFFSPDIDIDRLCIVPAPALSGPDEYLIPLRWTAVLSAVTRGLDISATTGIHDSRTALKLILAGADTVQLCSVLYKDGLEVIEKFNSDIIRFMDDNGFASVNDFRGKLNYSNIKDPAMYERVQFMKTFGEFR